MRLRDLPIAQRRGKKAQVAVRHTDADGGDVRRNREIAIWQEQLVELLTSRFVSEPRRNLREVAERRGVLRV